MKQFMIKNIKVILMIVTFGGFLFGYNTSIINGVIRMLSENRDFTISSYQIGVIVGILPLGAMIASIVFGKISDIFGRKRVITFIALMFIISVLVISTSDSVSQLTIGRFTLGLSIGAINTVVPIYITEISNKNNRGKMVMANQVMLVGSQLFAYIINYIFFYLNVNWRYMLLIAIIPSIVLFLGSLFIPDTKGRNNTKKDCYKKEEYLKKKKINKKVFIPGIALGIIHQFTGINTVMYYSSFIFSFLGLENEKSFLINIILGLVSVIGVMISFKIVDRYERKIILSNGLKLCAISLLLIILLNTFLSNRGYYVYLVALFIVLFVFSFQAFVGGIIWILISEIFPQKVRGLGMGISSASLWFSNFLTSFIFPIIIARYGLGISLVLFFVITTAAIPYVKCLKNTKGLSLEKIEISALK